MTRAIIIIGLVMGCSWSSYGQEITLDDTLPTWDNPWEQQLRWNRFLLKPTEAEKPAYRLGQAGTIDKVDPSMPIAVPSQDEFSRFPVKVIPEDFPSNMPVAKLQDAAPLKSDTKGGIKIIPWDQKNGF